MRCSRCSPPGSPTSVTACDAYYHLKHLAGLFAYMAPGANLSVAEQFLVGLLPKAPPSPLALMLAAEARRTEREARRLAGIRWLVDVAGMDERLEILT